MRNESSQGVTGHIYGIRISHTEKFLSILSSLKETCPAIWGKTWQSLGGLLEATSVQTSTLGQKAHPRVSNEWKRLEHNAELSDTLTGMEGMSLSW